MSKPQNIGIIGAGQLGSRHLQALAPLKAPVNIWVVDPSQTSLEISKARWEEVATDGKHKVSFISSIEMLPAEMDIVVVATGSMVRRKVIEALLQSCSVRFLILEKVLFPQVEDYEVIERLLEQMNVKAWVNCPRRQYPGYVQLKEVLKDQSFFMTVHGSQWGLACNSIHWVDIFSFLNNNSELHITPFLETEIIPSKRQGFIEFTGSITVKNTQESMLVVNCFSSGSHPLDCRIDWPAGSINIAESQQKIYKQLAEKSWEVEVGEFPVLRQSQLTNLVVEQLVKTGACSLTPFGESKKLHLPLIQTFLTHLNEVNQTPENLICPIT